MRLRRLPFSLFTLLIGVRFVEQSFAFLPLPRTTMTRSNRLLEQHQSNSRLNLSSNQSKSTSPVPPPPPAISVPVWSLATPRETTNNEASISTSSTSMNIVTFAIPVSVAAPKLWMVSLYHNTLTKESFCSSGRGVLQLLSPAHKQLVSVLGKHSGYDDNETYNKAKECGNIGFPWTESHPFEGALSILPECISYIEVEKVNEMEAGDHVAVLCQVMGTGTWDAETKQVVQASPQDASLALDQTTVLYTGLLRQEGIL